MRIHGRRMLFRVAMLGWLSLAVTAAPASAQGSDAGLSEELRRLNGAMARVVALLEDWTAESGRTERIRQVDELDRSIGFLDGELQARRADQAQLKDRAENLMRAMDRTEQQLVTGGEPGLIDLLETEADPGRRLEGQERELRRVQESLALVDARVVELRATLEQRRGMRDRLAERLDRELAAGSR